MKRRRYMKPTTPTIDDDDDASDSTVSQECLPPVVWRTSWALPPSSVQAISVAKTLWCSEVGKGAYGRVFRVFIPEDTPRPPSGDVLRLHPSTLANLEDATEKSGKKPPPGFVDSRAVIKVMSAQKANEKLLSMASALQDMSIHRLLSSCTEGQTVPELYAAGVLPSGSVVTVMEGFTTNLDRTLRVGSNFEFVGEFMGDLMRKLSWIHAEGVIHLDVKPANVVINDDCRTAICDMGISIRRDMIDIHRVAVAARRQDIGVIGMASNVVTIMFRAPELMRSIETLALARNAKDRKAYMEATRNFVLSGSTDVWSMGVIADAMSRGCPRGLAPHSHTTNSDVLHFTEKLPGYDDSTGVRRVPCITMEMISNPDRRWADGSTFTPIPDAHKHLPAFQTCAVIASGALSKIPTRRGDARKLSSDPVREHAALPIIPATPSVESIAAVFAKTPGTVPIVPASSIRDAEALFTTAAITARPPLTARRRVITHVISIAKELRVVLRVATATIAVIEGYNLWTEMADDAQLPVAAVYLVGMMLPYRDPVTPGDDIIGIITDKAQSLLSMFLSGDQDIILSSLPTVDMWCATEQAMGKAIQLILERGSITSQDIQGDVAECMAQRDLRPFVDASAKSLIDRTMMK